MRLPVRMAQDDFRLHHRTSIILVDAAHFLRLKMVEASAYGAVPY